MADIGSLVETGAAGGRRKRQTELGPQAPAGELQALERFGVYGIQDHQLAGRCDHDAAWRERAVGVAGVMQQRERGQQFQEQAEPRVEAGYDAVFGGSVEHVAEAASGDVLRGDRQPVIGAALNRTRPRKSFVLEARDDRQPLAQGRLECRQLRPQHQALEHVSRFPIEREHTSPQAIFVA